MYVEKSLSRNFEEVMNRLYKRVNKEYKTITREMINAIVHRIDEITDLYYDFVSPNLNSKFKKQNENALLTKRILRNETCPEAGTFDTVLNFICAVYHFLYAYDNEPHKLFHHCNIWDWMICALREFGPTLKYKETYLFNDKNIPETIERFLNIDDYEIMRLLKLNFPDI